MKIKKSVDKQILAYTRAVAGAVSKGANTLARGVIRCYRFFSPMGLPRCRFYPTCSSYSLQALKRFGFVHGGWLSIKRILRCHPWGYCGIDPVPSRGQSGQMNKNFVPKKDQHKK